MISYLSMTENIPLGWSSILLPLVLLLFILFTHLLSKKRNEESS